jgi:hypothetical protein
LGKFLYFSPKFPFAKLNLDDPASVVDALQDRVNGYYLQPAFRSLASGDAGGLARGLVPAAIVRVGAEHTFDAICSGKCFSRTVTSLPLGPSYSRTSRLTDRQLTEMG